MSTWLLTEFGSKKDFNRLKESIEKRGYDYLTMKFGDPFKENYPLGPEDEVVLYGSINVVKRSLRDNPKWVSWFDDTAMDTRTYLDAWKEQCLNYNDYEITTIEKVLDQHELLYELYGAKVSGYNRNVVPITDTGIFVRPVSNCKQFAGEVVFRSEYQEWEKEIRAMDMDCPPDLVVQVARPKVLLSETRCLMYQHTYVTGSRYRLDGEYEPSEEVDSAVIKFANSIVEYDSLPDPYILDIALTEDGPKIIEVGSVHCAGLYAMDTYKYVGALTHAADNHYSGKIPVEA